MEAKEMRKRDERAQNLRVVEVGEGAFLVESGKGKVFYKCMIGDETGRVCTCGDFQRHSDDESFLCKHLMAVEACMNNGGPEKREYLKRRQPKLNTDFIINLQGKDFVTYQGLLDLAHQKGLIRIETEILQYPTKDNGNTAVVSAVAESKLGDIYSDIGDANPTNCNSKIAKHIIRMASTRAKARALRDFSNVGITALEELGDLDEVIAEDAKNKATRKLSPRKTSAKSKDNSRNKTDAESEVNANTVPAEQPDNNDTDASKPDNVREIKPKMSEAQKRAIFNLSRRRGISVESLEEMAGEMYDVKVEELNSTDASSLIRHLQQAA